MKDVDQFLTLHHYKEPLKPVKGGFCYYGALLSTRDGDKLQCHVCGNLYQDLAKHACGTHKIRAKEYRSIYMLAKQTALCSDNERHRRRDNYYKWLASLSRVRRIQYLASTKLRLLKANEKRGRFQPNESLETKNKKGTCPDQLLDKIKSVAKILGKIPSKKEFIDECGTQRFVHLIYKTFGSWVNAIKMCNMTPRECVAKGHRNYSDEELLEYLRIFAQENGKVPTATDFRRGLLPSYECYTRRFKTIENARRLAGVYDFIDEQTGTFFKNSSYKTKLKKEGK